MGPSSHIHIEVQNVSPVSELTAQEAHSLGGLWRTPLGEIVEEVAKKVAELPEGQVTCFFPHDPSVPVNENPPVFVKVTYVDLSPTPQQLHWLKQQLRRRISDFVMRLREVEKIRVVVAITRAY